jgi:hypothetical protein
VCLVAANLLDFVTTPILIKLLFSSTEMKEFGKVGAILKGFMLTLFLNKSVAAF